MPFSIDSAAVNVPSYPSHAVEANPANTVQMHSRWRYLRADEVIERTTTVAVSRLAKPRWLGLLCASTPTICRVQYHGYPLSLRSARHKTQRRRSAGGTVHRGEKAEVRRAPGVQRPPQNPSSTVGRDRGRQSQSNAGFCRQRDRNLSRRLPPLRQGVPLHHDECRRLFETRGRQLKQSQYTRGRRRRMQQAK